MKTPRSKHEAENAVIKNRRESFEEAGHEIEVNGQDTEIDLETKTEVIEVKSGKSLPDSNQLEAQREYTKSKGKIM